MADHPGWRVPLIRLTRIADTYGVLIGHACLVPRHHVVPQFMLWCFADRSGRVRAVPRQGGEATVMTVRRAAAETDFYELEIEEQYQALTPPQRFGNDLARRGQLARCRPQQVRASALVCLPACHGRPCHIHVTSGDVRGCSPKAAHML